MGSPLLAGHARPEGCAPDLPAPALFHCRQAAEKLLKPFSTWNQTAFRKTHELHEPAAAHHIMGVEYQL